VTWIWPCSSVVDSSLVDLSPSPLSHPVAQVTCPVVLMSNLRLRRPSGPLVGASAVSPVWVSMPWRLVATDVTEHVVVEHANVHRHVSSV